MLQNLKVLYVEDEELTRQELSKIIKRRVGKLFIAKNGLEGLESFKKNSPDIVVTDLRMPDMNGLEMVKEIRKINKECKIIIISALSDSESILSAVDIGIVKYIVKPVNTQEFTKVLEELAEDIFKNNLEKNIDKDTKHALEEKIKREIASLIKTYSGKGPRTIEVFIRGDQIEVKASETLTLFELTIIEDGKNNSLVEYNRELFYKEKKELLEQTVSNIVNTQVELKEIYTDSSENIDKLVYSFL